MLRDVLPSVLAHRAGQLPPREFLRTTEGTSYSYAQAHEACLIWADAYERAGVGAGEIVATMLPTVPEAVFAWLGLAWLGAVEVPVNTSYRGGMLDYLLRDADVTVVVIAAEFLSRLCDIWTATLPLRLVVVTGAGLGDELPPGCVRAEEFLDGAVPRPRTEPRVSDLAAVIYTSGTTGRSKGVMVSWRHLNRLSTGLAPLDALGEQDVFYLPMPMFHGSGKGSVFLMALAGGVVVLRATFKTPAFWPDIRAHGCTTTMLLGAMAQFVYAEPARADDADSPLRNVLMVPVIPDVAAFRERFGVRVHTWYGITEAGCPIAATGWRLDPPGSCGRARPGYAAAVLDDDDRPVPAGVVGELVIRADGPWMLMAGYWGNPVATLGAWRNLWLHTGDAAHLDADGNVFFVDRQKDAMRRRGENISSVEVELETNTHPAVLESAAYAVPSQWGEDDVMIAVTCRSGRSISAEELFEHLAGRLPHFMVPRYIEIMADLPRTPTQKVQKNVLRERGPSAATWDREAAGAVVRRDRVTLPRAAGGV